MSDLVSRLAAALEGRYALRHPLGEGGMATVYLAEDLKHGRNVALKVLKPELAAMVGAERFLAEIRTTANLQHPHILPLFDSGEADGFLFYVMPYVQGESLRDRLEREKQLPVEEAVSIARDVADALQHAHGMGVVHRDVKPANILLLNGRPQVADFGIALALSSAGDGRLTETGLSLGTPHYMSPEQAAGDRNVDPRSDIYALGCVLYEMLAGEPPFAGPTAQAVLARLLTEEPRALTAVRKTVPGNVAAAVARALEKLPADRFPDVVSFGAALGDPGYSYTGSAASGARSRGTSAHAAGAGGASRFQRIHIVLTAALAVLAVALFLTRGDGEDLQSDVPPVAFVASDTGRIVGVSVAEDGTVAWGQSGELLLRPGGGLRARAIPLEDMGADGSQPVPTAFSLSPDGESLALASGEEIYTFSPATGTVNPVLHVEAVGGTRLLGVHWADDGWIYTVAHLGEAGQAVLRAPAAGGAPEEIFRTEEEDSLLIAVSDVIPGDGGILLGLIPLRGFHPQVAHLDVERGEITPVATDSVHTGQWSATGHIVYGRYDGSLLALPWDREARRARGTPVVLGTGVATQGGPPRLSVGRTGTLAYVAGPSAQEADMEATPGVYYLEWMSPDGSFTPLEMDATDHPDADVSPDGRTVAYTRGGDLRLFDAELGTDQVLVEVEEGQLHDPVWSPDGRFVAYRTGDGRIAVVPSDGSGDPRLLPPVPDSTTLSPAQWLGDGTLILVPDTVETFFAMPSDGSEPPRRVLEGGRVEFSPQVSPDGRWIAYFTQRSDGRQLVVRRWPDLDQERVLSGEGERLNSSLRLVWRADGRGLVYAGRGSGDAIETFEEVLFDPALEGGVGGRRDVQLSLPPAHRMHGVAPGGDILLISEGIPMSSIPMLTAVRSEELVVVSDVFALIREREAAQVR